ncbi:MAG: polysaccharide biosynthesis tyrosine autokinase [Sphaerochaetaceae bacterium]|nr:polysaccharide biosynthesis tyrosine autokinase [Sphaerochaetaceae bacterium]
MATDNSRIKNIRENVEEIEISIPQIFWAIKRRRIWIYLFFVVALAVAFFYLNHTDNVYEAGASAMVEPIQSGSSIEDMLSVSSSNSKIDTEVQLITSSRNLKNAINKLNISDYLDPDGEPYSKETIFKAIENGTFKEKISVSTVSNTKIVTITVKDTNPKFCADFANALLSAYSDMLTEIAKNSKSSQVAFIEEQIPKTEKLLEAAAVELSEYKEKSGVDYLAEKSSVLSTKIAMCQLEIEPLKLQLIEIETLLNTLMDNPQELVSKVLADPYISALLEDYMSNCKELILYKNIENNSESENRVYVLKNSISSKQKDIQDALYEYAGMSAGVVTDYVCVSTYIKAIDSVIEIYNNELTDYPVMERTLLDLQRNVQIYEQLLLSLRQLLEETRMVEAAVVSNVTVIDDAVIPTKPISPRRMFTLLVAAIGGILLGAATAVVLEFMDNTISDEDTVSRILGPDVPSLGWTPFVSLEGIKAEVPQLFVYNDPDGRVSERYRAVANNILYSVADNVQVISINSIDMGEGKTTTICNIAATYAMAGKKVLVIDGDFRRPSVENFFRVKKSKVGLVDAIVDHVPVFSCIVAPFDKIPNLHVLPPGKGTRNPNALYSSERMGEIMGKLRKYYDYIIIDCAPLSYGSEFTHIAKHLDGFIINIRAGVAQKGSLAAFMKEIGFIQAPLLGYVYYGVISRNQSSYGNYGHYGYGSSYGRYGKYGYGYGYSKKKGGESYKDARGSYKAHYKKEVIMRDKVQKYDKVPEKAFSTLDEFESGKGKAEVKKQKSESRGQDRTMDMLSEIENMSKKDES